jgi:AraC family transcriptional regulator
MESMPEFLCGRISVRRGGLTVPLMPLALASPLNPPASSRLISENHRVHRIEIPEHEHENFCLHLQTLGNPRLEWWWDGKNGVEEPRPGSLILLPPGTRDRLRWEGISERFIISLDSEYVSAVAVDSGCNRTVDFQTRWHFRDAALQSILAEIGREFSAGWPLGRLYADSLGLRLALALLKRQTLRPLVFRNAHGGLTWRALKLSVEYITDNLHRDIRLSDIARTVGLSQFHFARMFRTAAGQTPYQYLLDQRIARAKHLLRMTALPIEQIGTAVGFDRVTAFSRSFASREGLSARSWRKEVRCSSEFRFGRD